MIHTSGLIPSHSYSDALPSTFHLTANEGHIIAGWGLAVAAVRVGKGLRLYTDRGNIGEMVWILSEHSDIGDIVTVSGAQGWGGGPLTVQGAGGLTGHCAGGPGGQQGGLVSLTGREGVSSGP